MTLKSIYDYFASIGMARGFVFMLIMMSLIQISPIKLNPWTLLADSIERLFNKRLLEKVEDLVSKVNDVEDKIDMHIQESETSELQSMRYAILSFGSQLMGGANFHKERFDFIISECDRYQNYCKEKNITNGVADVTIQEIRRSYAEKIRNNDFLKGATENGQE